MKKDTLETFIEKAKTKHGNKYTYTDTNYVHSTIKVGITCKIHGTFLQTPSNHLTGRGCPECAKTELSSGIETFVSKADIIHKNKYTYASSSYINNKTKILITCPIHGNFKQTPNDHLKGRGCPECAKADRCWSWTAWEQQGTKSPHFDSFKLYTIACWNDNEHFYKIGKTFTTIGKRFASTEKLPYSWKVISTVEGDARTISQLELQKHTDLKMYSYTPNIDFAGNTECFSCYTLS